MRLWRSRPENRSKGAVYARTYRAKNPGYLKLARERGLIYDRSAEAKQKRKERYSKSKLQINLRRREGRKLSAVATIKNRLRSRLATALRKSDVCKTNKTFELIGCTPQFLKDHLESQFKPGMSWAQRNLWHIDHRIPCARFDLTDPKQQRACFHYTNLQPLWAMENIKKGERLWTDYSPAG